MRQAGADATCLLAGCLPWFLVLGVVESYLSPAPELPAELKAVLGLALLASFLIVAARPPSRSEAS
jgi:hypothetical protein